MKLTMVSLWFRGRRYTTFMMLPVVCGKVHLPDYNAFFRACGVSVPVGCTFGIGV